MRNLFWLALMLIPARVFVGSETDYVTLKRWIEVDVMIIDGDLAKVKAALEREPSLINAGSNQGDTFLHTAAVLGSLPIAEWLLANKAKVNAQDARGDTPLHGAAQNGHEEVVQLLIANGADVSAHAKDGATPLQLAARNSNETICKALISRGATVDVFSAACLNDTTSMIKLLDDKKASIDATDRYGWTPLMVAAAKGKKEAVRLLASRGANLNARDSSGNTALQLADKHPQTGTSILLRELGARE